MSTHDRNSWLYQAKLAEQAERYDEMVDFMKQVAAMGRGLDEQERNLLGIAYKNSIGGRRASWRVVSAIEQRESSRGSSSEDVATTQAYRKKIEDELRSICDDILAVLDEHLIPTASESGDDRVFYFKMKGDYLRYLAEFVTNDERTEAADKSGDAYRQAFEIASETMPPTHQTRLGLALNYSVFQYEIKNNHTDARDLALKAFNDAVRNMDQISGRDYKDSTLIMQLLRDNHALWSAENREEEHSSEQTQQQLDAPPS